MHITKMEHSAVSIEHFFLITLLTLTLLQGTTSHRHDSKEDDDSRHHSSCENHEFHESYESHISTFGVIFGLSGSIIVLIFAIYVTCQRCPSCYLYKRRMKQLSSNQASSTRVLTPADQEGTVYFQPENNQGGFISASAPSPDRISHIPQPTTVNYPQTGVITYAHQVEDLPPPYSPRQGEGIELAKERL